MESQNDPTSDPLLFWFNGGPGCSSLMGAISEIGPFFLNQDGETFQKNEYSWNTNASIVFLESPAGVGFSYTINNDYHTGDYKSLLDNYQAIKEFFRRIEKIVREVLIGQSELKTLTESYKRVIQSHKIDIKKIVTADKNQDNNRETQLEALENLNKQIQESEDIVKINELFGEFKKLSENLKNNDEEEKNLHQKLFEIRKQNDRFLRLIQCRLDEYCQRMMIMSEEHQSKKRNFDDNLDKEKDLMKDELNQAITLEFQKLRVKKLQNFVEDLEEIHFKHYNTQLDEYKDIIEKHKVLNLHVFQLENQLRATKFEKRKLPYNHAREIEDLTKSINHQIQTIRELEELLSEEQVSRVKRVQVAKREKRKLNLKLSKMLSESARNQALLCKQVHQALRKNLQVPARILDKSCKNVDECRCGEKEKSCPETIDEACG